MLRMRTIGRLISYALIVGLAAGSAACGGGHSAPTTPSGKRLAVMVYLERTLAPDTAAEKVQQLQQVSDWMEPDLLEVLRHAGYDAAAVTSVGGPTEPGSYTLRVQIVEYNPGSKAARWFAGGWGAGQARLQAQFELLGPNGQSYATGMPAASTGRVDWKHAVRKVDQEIVAAVNARLNQGL